jgi:tetratricopeptide (TPR) repeat protein
MILCLGRPELLEIRAGWMSGKPDASQLMLHPLTESETAGLIHNLLIGARMSEEASAQIASVAEGNPLFVEETLRMLVDDGLLRREDGSWSVTGDLSHLSIPPTIHALLTARLERLDQEERAVIERAAVIGRVFWWGAVSELSPEDERSRVGAYLQSLNRKELVRPDYSDFREEDAFRFAHMLIRDAAYSAIPKATRADLHARFADWIGIKAKDRAGEYEELVGYHLEQGYRYLSELGRANGRAEELGRRAATPLASAGRRAFARGDMPGAVNLLSRATSMLPPGDRARVDVLPDLAFALLETGDFARLQEVVSEAKRVSEDSGDAILKARAQILDLWMRVFTDPEGWAEEAYREALAALATFEEQHDEPGLATGWSLLGLVQLLTCQFASSEEAWEKAAAHAHEAGNQRQELEYLSWLLLTIWGGPTPTEEAIRRCREVFQRAQGDRKAMATALIVQAKLEAMRGRFDEARELVVRGRALGQEVDMPVWMAGPLTQFIGWVELLAGDPNAAEDLLRPGAEALREIGEMSWLSTVAAILAEALRQQNRFGEAEEFIQMSREAAGSEDVYSQSMLRSVWAKQMVRQDEADSARQLAREAVEITRPTDFRFAQAFALTTLGEVLLATGRTAEGQDVLAEAIRVCEEKGYTVGADAARRLLETAGGEGRI